MFILTLTLVFCILANDTLVAPAATCCKSPFAMYGSDCAYATNFSIPASWCDMRMYCLSYGADLYSADTDSSYSTFQTYIGGLTGNKY